MTRSLFQSLVWSAGLALCGPALADGAGPCGITTHVRADGTVELSNTGSTTACDVPAGPAAADARARGATDARVPPAAAAAVALPAAAPAAPADSPQPPAGDGTKDPRESYRDAMLQGAPGTSAANPAVSRRYKMMNKETYQATVLGGAAPGSPAGATPSQ